MTTDDLKAAFRWHLRRSYARFVPSRTALALQLARQDAANGKSRYPSPMKPYPAVSWQPDQPGMAYVEKPENAGLRLVGRVMPEAGGRNGIWDNRGDCGWHTDPYGDTFRDGTGLCYGVVYQLPGRNGESRFVAGYQFGGCDGGPILDMGTIYVEPRDAPWSRPHNIDAARDAALAADSMAQHAAEQAREHETAWQAGSRYADELRDAAATRQEILGILKERRDARNNAAISDSGYFKLCDAIRVRVASLLSDLRDNQRNARNLSQGDDSALSFWSGDKRLQEAFCEGAGIQTFPA